MSNKITIKDLKIIAEKVSMFPIEKIKAQNVQARKNLESMNGGK